MLTKTDLQAIEKLLTPIKGDLRVLRETVDTNDSKATSNFESLKSTIDKNNAIATSNFESLKKTMDRHERSNEKRHAQLQDSINIIVDDLGEDVTLLKEKTKRIEKHLGFAQIT